MNEHLSIVEYLEAKGEGGWDVGIRATRILREIRQYKNMKEKEEAFWRIVFGVPEGQTVSEWIRSHSTHLPNGTMFVTVSK